MSNATVSGDTVVSSGTELDRLAVQIRDAHEAVTAGGALERARDAGRLLLAAKEECGHGEWLPWLEVSCPDVGARQVQKYMKLAISWGAIAPRLTGDAHLSIEGALRLLTENADDEPESHLSQVDSDLPTERCEALEHEHEVVAEPEDVEPEPPALPPPPVPRPAPAPKPPHLGQLLVTVRREVARLNGRQWLAPEVRAARIRLLEATSAEIMDAVDRLRTKT